MSRAVAASLVVGVLVFSVVILALGRLADRVKYEKKIADLKADLITCDSGNIQLEKQLTQAEIKCAAGQMEVHETLLQCMEELMRDAKEEVDIMKRSKNDK